MAKISYVIGDDVLSQTKSYWNWNAGTSAWVLQSTAATEYLLYDGHGSTRQLINSDLTVADSYSYDGYGVMLSDNSEAAANADTNLLYCGEQYDKSLDQYYLRARYYNPLNGLFNQVDSYSGNRQDPQSLHKYAYCHNNPVNAVDPSGRMGLIGWSVAIFVVAIIAVIVDRYLGGPTYRSGLSHPTITNDDIRNSIKGVRNARDVLENLIKTPGTGFNAWEDFIAYLNGKGIHVVGEMGIGIVGMGTALSPGRQRIVEYFETWYWNARHPKARQHQSPLLYHGYMQGYIADWCGWESERLGIVLEELRGEARRRGLPE